MISCFVCDSKDVTVNKEGNPLDGTGDWECTCNHCGAEWFTTPRSSE